MTNQEILETIQKIQESLNENDLDVKVVNAIINLRSQINQYKNPTFTKEGVPVMEHWNDFKYWGLNNCDYVRTEFYDEGWVESEF